MIQILIVDDQRLMRDGLKTLLSLENDLEIVSTASNGEEAVQLVQSMPIDVVLMDIRMPVKNGIEATREIVAMYPHIKILILTTFEEQNDVVDALSAGAVGYLLKDMPAEEIADAVRTAYKGGAILPPNIAKTFLSAVQKGTVSERNPLGDAPLATLAADASLKSESSSTVALEPNQDEHLKEHLTEREVDVLHCLAKGMSNREISDALFVTEGTVKNHVSNLIAKLTLRDRTQVALYAVRHGYGSHPKN